MIILIDNGHGENTPGKCSPDRRLLEWSYTREIASRVVARLKSCGHDARLLVPETSDIPLSERCRRANVIYADAPDPVLLVSIHVNAAGNDGLWHDATGWEVWTSPGTTLSDSLATSLYKAAGRVLPPLRPDVAPSRLLRSDFSDGDCDKEARFTILTRTRCPAVLTENLFQDNRLDVDFLLSPRGLNAMTELHCSGILDFISTL